MTVHYCDHCGKEIKRFVSSTAAPHYYPNDGIILNENETLIRTKLMVCSECYEDYWDHRKQFDIEFFTANK